MKMSITIDHDLVLSPETEAESYQLEAIKDSLEKLRIDYYCEDQWDEVYMIRMPLVRVEE